MTELGPWEPFDVQTVAELMNATGGCWWLSGGVALDVFVGRRTRAHGDIDVSLRRSDWDGFRRRNATRLDMKFARNGALYDVTDAPLRDDFYGVWARTGPDDAWRLQINLEPVDGAEWVYRRDARVRRTLGEAIHSHAGVPCVNPAVQLLWKSKHATAKDEVDFDNIVPLLPAAERVWLAGAIAIAHPDSPWRGRL